MTEIIHSDELPLFSADDFNKLVLKLNSEGKSKFGIRVHRISDELIKKICEGGYRVFKEYDDPQTYFINW